MFMHLAMHIVENRKRLSREQRHERKVFRAFRPELFITVHF